MFYQLDVRTESNSVGTTIFFSTNFPSNALVTILIASHYRFHNMKMPK